MAVFLFLNERYLNNIHYWEGRGYFFSVHHRHLNNWTSYVKWVAFFLQSKSSILIKVVPHWSNGWYFFIHQNPQCLNWLNGWLLSTNQRSWCWMDNFFSSTRGLDVYNTGTCTSFVDDSFPSIRKPQWLKFLYIFSSITNLHGYNTGTSSTGTILHGRNGFNYFLNQSKFRFYL